MNTQRSRLDRAPLRSPRARRSAGRAMTAAALLLASASVAGAATTLRTAPLYATEGDVLTCSAVNWDEKPRSIAVRIALVVGGGGEVAAATCNPTVPLASCIAIESVSVPIVGSGFFACEVQADVPRSRVRALLENVTTGRNVEAR